MSRSGFVLIAVVLVAGCCSHDLAPTVPPAAPQLPATTRTAIEPDVSAATVNLASSPPTRPNEYRRLTAAECRTFAISNAPLAADLDTHPDNTPPNCSLLTKRTETAQLSRMVRGYAADEIRNRSAADALELYYKLALAEGQFDLVSNAHSILRVQHAAAEKAIKGGAADRGDVEKLRRQMLELESQLAKLEAGIAVLNAGLAGSLGLDPADQTPIWPDDPLRVRGDTVDVDQAVQTGQRYRPDLNLLRTLASNEEYTGELTKAVLTSVNPLLATTDPANPLLVLLTQLKKEPTKADAKLHRQVVGLLATRERQEDSEIRAAAATWRGNHSAVAAKAAEVRNLTAKVAELEKREAGVSR